MPSSNNGAFLNSINILDPLIIVGPDAQMQFASTQSPDELFNAITEALQPYEIKWADLRIVRSILQTAIAASPSTSLVQPGPIKSTEDRVKQSKSGHEHTSKKRDSFFGPPTSADGTFYFHHTDKRFPVALPNVDLSRYKKPDERELIGDVDKEDPPTSPIQPQRDTDTKKSRKDTRLDVGPPKLRRSLRLAKGSPPPSPLPSPTLGKRSRYTDVAASAPAHKRLKMLNGEPYIKPLVPPTSSLGQSDAQGRKRSVHTSRPERPTTQDAGAIHGIQTTNIPCQGHVGTRESRTITRLTVAASTQRHSLGLAEGSQPSSASPSPASILGKRSRYTNPEISEPPRKRRRML